MVVARCVLMGLLLAAGAATAAENPIREWRVAHEQELVEEFTALLAIPNLAHDRENIWRNAELIVSMMQRRDLSPRLLELDDPDVPPIVYGEWRVPGATETLVLYAHYDGQPVNPDEWASSPWTPTWRDGSLAAGGKVIEVDASTKLSPDWRIYGRAASDDKAGVFAILAATDALKGARLLPTVNLRFVFEGEEEAGSPHIGALLAKYKELFGPDPWIICDGPVHSSGRKLVAFGVRGDANVDLTVYGAKRPLHSGHYGNWSPNPAMRLAQLLASMKSDDGRVAIAGWYDDVAPLGELERRAIAEAPDSDADVMRELGIAAPEIAGMKLLEAIQLPSLNINGMRSGNVGDQASNQIPTFATAVLDLRFVKGNDPARQYARLVSHVEKQGYFVIDREPTDAERAAHPLIATMKLRPGSYAASRTAMDLPIAKAVAAAVESAAGAPIVRFPTMGGSLPLVVITDVLGAPTINVPIANHDNNQHAENENLRLGNLWDGIEIMAAVMQVR
jgi:acetylornithine deacetylase/succinyl-diaminopimelate desuccinylase-like protein